MHKKNILFIMHELSLGGAERVISNLVNNMSREQFNNELCLFKKKGSLIKSLKNDIIIYDLKAKRVATSIVTFVQLLIKKKPDIIFTSITHVNLLLSILIPFLRPFMRNTLFITREVNIPSIRAQHLKKSKKIDFFYRIFIHNYDYIIAQSNYMKKDIINSYGVSPTKIKVISNPLDITNIHQKTDQIETNNLFNDNSKINLVAVGNLRKQKGFDTLLEIISLLDNEYHLNILGDGNQKEFLEQKIKELELQEKVTLHGMNTNPYKYMKAANLVVLSSQYEGFPNVILEANACGKFVVTFQCPGVSEEIIENGVNGYLVENGNIAQFADAIKKYSNYSHDEQKIIATTEKYKASNIVKEYEKIFLGNENE